MPGGMSEGKCLLFQKDIDSSRYRVSLRSPFAYLDVAVVATSAAGTWLGIGLIHVGSCKVRTTS